MKKCVVLLVMVFFLMGCSAAETFETVSDDIVQPVLGEIKELSVKLPDHAAAPVVNQSDGARLYICDGYTLALQTLAGGDLNRTAKQLCGFPRESLTLLTTAAGEVTCHEWVWTCAGEGGDQVGRVMVLEDGGYHYCLTAMADAAVGASLQPEWDQIFASVSLS